jgi:glycosyltransferase involved in cell wall biosynthesis
MPGKKFYIIIHFSLFIMFIAIEASHANKPQRTGVEEYSYQIIQGLKKIIPSDVRVVLYSNEPLSGELGVLPLNWSVKILRWPFKKLWSQIRLSWEFIFYPPDIFFAPSQLVPIFCPKNSIVMIHDNAFVAHPRAYRFFGRQYLKLMNQLIVRKAKIILTSTEFNKRELIKYYGNDVGEKTVVIPLAYDESKFFVAGLIQNKYLTKTKKILEKYFIERPFIISIGRLEEKKNTKRIVQAFNLLRSGVSKLEVQLFLIGNPGAGYVDVKKEIDNSPYKKDIITPGWVEADELLYLLQSASVFVFPSLYEGFGLPALEAMACGCPVILSKDNALEEVTMEAGVYVNPLNPEEIASAIEKFISNADYRQQKITAGLARARLFSWEETAKKSWEAIKSLLL